MSCVCMAFHKESKTYLHIAVRLYNWNILFIFFLFFSTTKWCMGDCPLGKGVCLC